MSLSNTEQLKELFEKSMKPLIALPANAAHDTVAAALALQTIGKKLNKKINTIAPEYTKAEILNFLPDTDTIQTTVDSVRKFLITVNTAHTKVADFSYQIKDNELEIQLTPKEGYWQPEDVHTKHHGWVNDLVMVLGSEDLESLGKLFDHHAELFHNNPIVNIDYHPENESFGQINIVNIKATSVCEVLYEVLKKWDETLIDERVATYLLTGIIDKTQSFKLTTTPLTLSIASELIQKGADRKKIVKNLYQQKKLSTLKLWGRVLARLKYDENTALVWSILPHQDFNKTGAQAKDLPGIIDELIVNSPQTGMVVIVYEKEKRIHGLARLINNHYNLLEALEKYEPHGSQTDASFTLPEGTDIKQTEGIVINALQEYIKNQQS